MRDVDGQRIQRELRFPAPELKADSEYQALRERCLADGMRDGVTLEALDPRYRTVLSESGIARLFASIALPVRAGPDAVRYATGLAAHNIDELTLRIGHGIAMGALMTAGFDPQEPRVLARSCSVRVHANNELKSVIDRIGIHHPSANVRLADHYLLDAGEDGRLTVRYQLLAGGRYAGRFDVGQLNAKLASAYAADSELAQLRGANAAKRRASPAIPAAPAPGGVEELREQLAMLQPEGQSLKLPIQALSRFAELRRLLEKLAASTARTGSASTSRTASIRQLWSSTCSRTARPDPALAWRDVRTAKEIGLDWLRLRGREFGWRRRLRCGHGPKRIDDGCHAVRIGQHIVEHLTLEPAGV